MFIRRFQIILWKSLETNSLVNLLASLFFYSLHPSTFPKGEIWYRWWFCNTFEWKNNNHCTSALNLALKLCFYRTCDNIRSQNIGSSGRDILEMKSFLRFSGEEMCLFAFTHWCAGRLSPPKKSLDVWKLSVPVVYTLPQWMISGYQREFAEHRVGRGMHNWFSPAQHRSYTYFEVLLGVGVRAEVWEWRSGAGGGGELGPRCGEQDCLICSGATPKPELPQGPSAISLLQSLGGLLLKPCFLCVRFFNDKWFSSPQMSFC